MASLSDSRLQNRTESLNRSTTPEKGKERKGDDTERLKKERERKKTNKYFASHIQVTK